MHLFIEKGMTEGICYIAKIHSKADNKYMKWYDHYKENKFVMYLDANNLHRCAMGQYLHYSEFEWLNQKEIHKFCLNSNSENSSDGYILGVDLKYPDQLHELHDHDPLAPEKLEITQNMLSKYCSNIADKYGVKIGGVNKLITNLGSKSKYVLHYRNLQLYLSLGMKLTKVHRILKFKQCDCLKRCINFNTVKRKNAANSFEKYFFKLMNNSVFGKTMENLKKNVNVRLVNSAKDYVRYLEDI